MYLREAKHEFRLQFNQPHGSFWPSSLACLYSYTNKPGSNHLPLIYSILKLQNTYVVVSELLNLSPWSTHLSIRVWCLYTVYFAYRLQSLLISKITCQYISPTPSMKLFHHL